MKLSKALLGAMLVGIAVQTTVTSCTKKDKENVKPQTESQSNTENGQTNNGDCPACGMG